MLNALNTIPLLSPYRRPHSLPTREVAEPALRPRSFLFFSISFYKFYYIILTLCYGTFETFKRERERMSSCAHHPAWTIINIFQTFLSLLIFFFSILKQIPDIVLLLKYSLCICEWGIYFHISIPNKINNCFWITFNSPF